MLSWGHWELVNLGGDGAILPDPSHLSIRAVWESKWAGSLRLKELHEAEVSILVEVEQ